MHIVTMKFGATWKSLIDRLGVILLGTGIAAAVMSAPAQNLATTQSLPAAPMEVDAMAMLCQSMAQFKHSLETKNLEAIHDEDAIVSAAVYQLLDRADSLALKDGAAFKNDLTTFGQKVTDLHAAADLNQQNRVEKKLTEMEKLFARIQSSFPPAALAAAQKKAARFTCPMHPDVVGQKTDLCPKCGMALEQMIRVFPVNSSLPATLKQTVRASVRLASPLTVGQPATAYLRLHKANGDPVDMAGLLETHTKKIHLLIIDGSLTDYHHEHPQPTAVPGEYRFAFTPLKPGPYRVWADLRPSPLGLQQYAVTDIPAATAGLPFTNRTVSYKTTADGLNYELIVDETPIRVGKSVHARLRVTSPDGNGFAQLEPIMATFAHLVGFNEDYQTVLHLHPKGPPVLDANARGGPDLEFQIYAMQPGFVRLFAQVQIGGQSHFAPFGINVAP